jgi:hypothetical protein
LLQAAVLRFEPKGLASTTCEDSSLVLALVLCSFKHTSYLDRFIGSAMVSRSNLFKLQDASTCFKCFDLTETCAANTFGTAPLFDGGQFSTLN